MHRRVVLIPGLLCTEAVWARQAEALARGSPAVGSRPAVPPAAVTVVNVAAGSWTSMEGLALSILREVPGDERFSVAGLSMGGYAALALLRAAPERVERLALVSSQARGDSAQTRSRREALMAMARSEGALDGVMELQAPLLLAPGLGSDSELAKDPGSALSTVLEMAQSTGIDDFCRQQVAIAGRRDQRDLLPRVRVPSLVLCGRQDALIPFAVHQQVAAALASSPGLEPDALSPVTKPPASRGGTSAEAPARANAGGAAAAAADAGAADAPGTAGERSTLMLRVLEECGHLPTIERPDETTQALFDWLALPTADGPTALLP
mmetsp:Transcript_15386/g.58180  ORF Transcript_15386/g.58180 Transcript_15386/m.58180 type:complete len:323 (-) Transcript_15386:1428-2396(-)